MTRDDVEIVEHHVRVLVSAKRPVASVADDEPAKDDIRGVVNRDAVNAAVALLIRLVVAVATVDHAALLANDRHVCRVVYAGRECYRAAARFEAVVESFLNDGRCISAVSRCAETVIPGMCRQRQRRPQHDRAE